MNIHSRMKMGVTAFHMVDNLSTGLYEDPGQRLMELLRNSLAASMPSPLQWEPKRAKIEISLARNHPLAPKDQALIMLDHGCGLTDQALERYFGSLGTSLSQLKEYARGEHTGASQKGIGRFAALGLNLLCHHEDRLEAITHGYYLFSRTAPEGEVRFVPVIPKQVEEEGGFAVNRFLSPAATELGPLRNIKGSFTAIVIPTPVFKTHQEICRAIEWKLPREQDKMFQLLVGNKPLDLPPLESDVNATSVDGHFRARLGVGDGRDGGVWLCDDVTGFRVADCRKHAKQLPEPLWFPELVGDIFAPGLLRHQNTARSSLTADFFRKNNGEAQRLMMFLIKDVVPPARQLIERDAISGDAADAVDELAQLFNDRFGEPEEERKRSPDAVPPVTPAAPRAPRSSDGESDTSRESRGDAYRRQVSIKVREETFKLYRGRTLHPFVFAEVNPSDPTMIFVNVRGGYKALPKAQQARNEHVLVQLLLAIGRSKHLTDPDAAVRFANEVRAELFRSKM